MKRKNPYIRVNIFEIILLLILFVNSFIYNFLSNYYMIAFLVLLLITFNYLFGFEKDRHRHTKDVIINILIYLMTFFILYYLSGLFLTFAKNAGYYTFEAFFKFTLRVAIYVVLREFLRYQFLNKCEGSKKSTILTMFLFIFLDVTNNIYFYTFNSYYQIFIFIALYLMPAIGNTLLASFLCRRTGYKPVIFYMLVMELYTYILPIFPNPNKYIASIISFSVPLILLYRQYTYFLKESDDDVPRNYNKNSIPWLILSLIITVILVYFSSGYFHYHAVAVASGSMAPVIHKGDVVVIERIENNNFEIVQDGDVIAFEYSDTIVVHRITKIVKDRGQYFFYTKGDANRDADNFVVEEDMLKGVVRYKIPVIGYPTVWLNRL